MPSNPDDVPNMEIPDDDGKFSDASRRGGYIFPKRSDKPHDARFGSSPVPASTGWKVGDRVLARWEPMYMYAGRITKITDDQAMIEFDDGDSGWVNLNEMIPLALSVGMRVMSRRSMGPHFFPGKLAEVNGEKVRVAFDDGQPDERTTVASLRIPCESKGRGAEQIRMTSHLKPGNRVWALWQNTALFVGTITSVRDNEVHVQFDDGDQAWVSVGHLFPLELAPGMFVMGRWKMGRQFYPGKITQVNGESVHIQYDDGDREWTTPAALALPLNSPPRGPGPAPRGAPAPAATSGCAVWIVVSLIGTMAAAAYWFA
ncbi:MAG: hypothetical protein HYR84_05765 [Planctomycetes bacterium]|nr:hypothetical protein [Planctomycetota bacterium]